MDTQGIDYDKHSMSELVPWGTERVPLVSTLVGDYMDRHNLPFENEATLTHIVTALGYKDINHFLTDNSGAVSAVIEWVINNPCSEWVSKLQ